MKDPKDPVLSSTPPRGGHRHSGNKYLNVFCLDGVYADIHFATLLHYEALSAASNGAVLRATSVLLKIIH